MKDYRLNMTLKKLKVGLLGAGFICDYHAKVLKGLPNVEISAVCDNYYDKAEKIANAYGIEKIYTSLDDMLSDSDINIVHVLLPPNLHVGTSKKILQSGRHVFLEKPMGLSVDECRTISELADEKKVTVGINHNFLFLPSYEKLRRQVIDGFYGKIDQVTINWLYPMGLIQFGPFNNWILQKPENLLFEIGPHLLGFCIDLIGTMSQIKSNIFRPIELPGGNLVYRHWHIQGQKEGTAITLNYSVTPGVSDRSIAIRGHAANGRCDYSRDMYYVDEPSGYGLQVDNLSNSLSAARQLTFSGIRNFIRVIYQTLRKSPSANPFGESMERSIKKFYKNFNDKIDPRHSCQLGIKIISALEEIAKGIPTTEPVDRIAKSWSVLPPITKPKILVIGGTGFIGKYLVERLVRAGHSVRVVTRSKSNGEIALAGMPIDLVQGDLGDSSFIDSVLDGIEIVFHLARATGKKWSDYYTNDVLVTKNIAERAMNKGVYRFIYTGTIDSYYSADPKDVIDSDTPLDSGEDRNYYSRSKTACEKLLLNMYRESNFPVVILRPGIVIGKGSPPAHWGVGMFQSETLVQLWGDGKNKLPLVLVEDVAEGLFLAMEKDGIEGQSFLLTDDPLLTARDYVKCVSQECGTRLRMKPKAIWKYYLVDFIKESIKNMIKHPNRRKASYRDWASRSQRARYDNTKTRNLLGWKPAGTREALKERGIIMAVRDYYR